MTRCVDVELRLRAAGITQIDRSFPRGIRSRYRSERHDIIFNTTHVRKARRLRKTDERHTVSFRHSNTEVFGSVVQLLVENVRIRFGDDSGGFSYG